MVEVTVLVEVDGREHQIVLPPCHVDELPAVADAAFIQFWKDHS